MQEIFEYIVYVLAGFYGLLVVLPLVQLIRVQYRVPGLGWTTQKIFLFLTIISSAIRAAFFLILPIDQIHHNFFMLGIRADPVFNILNTLPALLYFSTYTVLILFWAEIIYHARNQTKKLRPNFVMFNIGAFFVVIGFCVLLYFVPSQAAVIDLGFNLFFCLLYIAAASGSLTYGGRLYFMLKKFPIDSRGRQSKKKEVGWVSLICAIAFIIRATLLIYSSFSQTIDANDFFIGGFYLTVEVIPSLLVLWFLRKLPPPRIRTVTSPYKNLNNSSFTASSDTEYYKVTLDVN